MNSTVRIGRLAPMAVPALAALLWIGCSDAASTTEVGLFPGDPSELAVRTNKGLVAAYGFDEPTGSGVSDASGASNEGAFAQGVTRTTAGKFGGALVFNGTGRVIIPNSSSLNPSKGATVSAWVKPTSATTEWRDVVYKGDDAYYLMATSTRSSRPAAGLRLSKTAQTQVFGSATLPTNTWTHLAMTFDGSAIRLYVNGAQVAGVWGSGTITSTTNPLEIGGDGIYGQFFQGTIDEVRVYNRALGSLEIRADMEKPIASLLSSSGGGLTGTSPKLTITSPSPTTAYRTTARAMSMSGTATSSVVRVTWANNRGGSGTASGTTAWEATSIPLQTGDNAVSVIASDAANNADTASVTVTVSDPAATALSITTQPSAAAVTGVAFAQQPAIQLRDASNNAVSQSGVVVTAAIATGTGTLGGTITAMTNASGVATFTGLNINSTGAFTLQFTAPGLAPVTSASITLGAAAATKLSITTQPSSSAISAVAFAQQPVIQLRDAFNNAAPQAGVVVTAAIQSGGGTLGGALTATTDASGAAKFTNLMITGTAGARSLSFTATNLTSVTSGSIVLAAAPATQLTITTQPSTSAVSGAAFAQQPVIQLRDASGTAVSTSGIVVTVAKASGSGTLGGTLTATTNASGVASFSGLSITGSGSHTLQFTATGLTQATSSTINVTSSSPSSGGLVLAQGFEEGAGSSTIDLSGNGNSGSFGAGVARTTAGRFGGGLVFASGTVTVPNSVSLSLTSGMTLEAWVNPSTVDATYRDVIFKATDIYYLMASSEQASPAGGILVAGTSGTTKAYGSTPLPTNTWTHLASTYDGVNMRLYVNGTLVSTTPRAGAMATSTSALTFGGDPIFGQQFQGTIDEVRIYNRALSGAEIQIDMATPVGGTALPDTQQPTIAITTPTSASTFTTNATSITLGGTASDNYGVTQVTWSNAANGANGTASGTGTWSANVSLAAGANVVTVTARDAANNTSTDIITITQATSPGTQLAVPTQPSTSAQSGVPFARQPAIQVRDASGNAVGQSGLTITAAIASGGGTLGGTTTATTNSLGVATFTNLSITGTDGSRTLSFAAPSLTSATSSSISISAASTGGSTGGMYPNRPAAFTQSSEIDFSQAIPSTSPFNQDKPISGSDWYAIWIDPGSTPTDWTKTADASAPQSPSGLWQSRWRAGSYGGGVIGQGGGHGIGNVFTYGPNGTFSGANRMYVSLRVYFDFDASQWHPISNKFVNITGNNSQILVQLKEGSPWRHAEELGFSGYSSFGVDNSGDPHSIPGQVDNRPVPTRQWTQIEVLVDLPNHVFKIWQDGVLTTNATPNFASTKINTFGINAFRGGGGETLTTDLFWKYDHFFIAW